MAEWALIAIFHLSILNTLSGIREITNVWRCSLSVYNPKRCRRKQQCQGRLLMLSAFSYVLLRRHRKRFLPEGSSKRLFYCPTASVLHTLIMHSVLVAWKKRDAVSVMTPTAWRSVATTKTSSYTDYQRLAHEIGRSTIGIRRSASSRPFLIGVNQHGQ